jgi:rRNA maturation endonuclease Nob1
MTDKKNRPFPFLSDHDWVTNCSTCPFNHHETGEEHCRKCGITTGRAKEREEDVPFNACPIRDVGRCSGCGKIRPIGCDSPPHKSLCPLCLHPDTLIFRTAEEARKAILDDKAGMPPDPPIKKVDERPS